MDEDELIESMIVDDFTPLTNALKRQKESEEKQTEEE